MAGDHKPGPRSGKEPTNRHKVLNMLSPELLPPQKAVDNILQVKRRSMNISTRTQTDERNVSVDDLSDDDESAETMMTTMLTSLVYRYLRKTGPNRE